MRENWLLGCLGFANQPSFESGLIGVARPLFAQTSGEFRGVRMAFRQMNIENGVAFGKRPTFAPCPYGSRDFSLSSEYRLATTVTCVDRVEKGFLYSAREPRWILVVEKGSFFCPTFWSSKKTESSTKKNRAPCVSWKQSVRGNFPLPLSRSAFPNRVCDDDGMPEISVPGGNVGTEGEDS